MGGNSSPLSKYKLLSEIGSGNAIVYKAQDLKTQQFYAIKFTERKNQPIVEKKLKEESDSLDELKKENDSLAKLHCPHICKMYESFMCVSKIEGLVGSEIKQYWCVVLHYYEEGDLRKRIKTCREKKSLTGRGTTKDELQIIIWMAQLFEAVNAIHKSNMIHRDLKPENIFLDEENIKIGHFGIAEPTAYSFVGTRGYYAPEVWKGDGYSAKADMYSLGCILLDLLTLTLTPDIESKNKDRIKMIPSYYSAKWVSIVESLLDEDYARRWSAADLEIALHDVSEFRFRTPSKFLFQFPLSTTEPRHVVSDGQSLYINHSNFIISMYDLKGSTLESTDKPSKKWRPRQMEILKKNHQQMICILQSKSMTIFNQEHKPISHWELPHSQEKNVFGISFKVDHDRIYFTLNRKHQIYICTSVGKEITRYGSEIKSEKKGQFDSPCGVTVDKKFLYVCDYENHRIQKLFKADGKFIQQWGQGGTEKRGDFFGPHNILVWENFLYISDLFRVQMFNKEGLFIKYIGTGRSGNGLKGEGEFNVPRGLCVVNKQIYVTDSHNNRIQVFTC